jgi:hypothetical protein
MVTNDKETLGDNNGRAAEPLDKNTQAYRLFSEGKINILCIYRHLSIKIYTSSGATQLMLYHIMPICSYKRIAPLIVVAIFVAIIISSNLLIHTASAAASNASTNTTSKTPIDLPAVMKQGQQSVDNQLDQARQALMSKNILQAVQHVEQAKQQLAVLIGCFTAPPEPTPNGTPPQHKH